MKDVKIYTLDYCPYCKAAINFLKDNEVKYRQVRIDNNEKNMRRGYLDTLKVLKKLDGFEYTFKRRPFRQYKHFVKYIDRKLYNATEVLVGKEGIKNVVIGAVEKALKKEMQNELKVYDIKNTIKYINSLNRRGIIYDFIRDLNI